MSPPTAGNPGARHHLLASYLKPAVLLGVILLVLFYPVLDPKIVVFSNDGPLGIVSTTQLQPPGCFVATWMDLNSVGYNGGAFPPGLSGAFRWLVGPVLFSKLFPVFCLFLLGVGALMFFRTAGFTPAVCMVGSMATMLNSSFFSAACWGVASHAICIGASFLALAFLADLSGWKGLLRCAAAGACVGLAIMEGADIGALFSLVIAGYVVFKSYVSASTAPMRRIAMGSMRVVVIASFAALVAAQFLVGLIQVQIKGVAGTAQDTRSKQERWDFSTQWSLPKSETLSFAAPGIFGYRMDTPDGGNYWGAIGRDPNWDRYFASGSQGKPPPGFMRFSGGGIYTGVLVLLLAAWAVGQATRGKDSVFGDTDRRLIAFWAVVAFLSLLLSWGRFAPFYQFLYALPYFSTIRNPAKFTHIVNFALVILFAYGVQGVLRRGQAATSLGPVAALGAWWKQARGFDRRWALGTLAVLGMGVIGFFLYSANRSSLEQHLATVQFPGDLGKEIASFSIAQAGFGVLRLALGVGLVFLLWSGWFAGRRAKVGGLLLGAFLLLDLGTANRPFLVFWDWERKYATNPVLEFFREKPYEHRVALLPFPMPPQLGYLPDLYRIEWAQHHFYRYNIQSLDLVQLPRMPEDMLAFETAAQASGPGGLLRKWELTNTRYLLGPAAFAEGLNTQFDPELRRFSATLPFNVVPKPDNARPSKLEDLTAVLSTNGPWAVIEFAGALPRASLFPRWAVLTNAEAHLTRLFDTNFNPHAEVLLLDPVPATAVPGTNAPGTVTYLSYAPKQIRLKAEVPGASPQMLLLNDRYDPTWFVSVDGQPAPLLRANHFMRAVLVPPGTHEVEFAFRHANGPLYITLSAIGVTLLLVGFLVVRGGGANCPPANPATPSAPAGDRKRSPATY